MRRTTMMVPLALAVAAALAGCGRNNDVKVQRVTAALATPTPTPVPTVAPTPPPAPQPTKPPPLVAFIPGARPVRVFGYQGSAGLATPDEVRLYAIDTSGVTVLRGSRGTVQIDAVGTAPLPLKLSPNSRYLYAKLPLEPKLPVGVRFQLYDPAGKWNSTGAFISRVVPMPDDLDESQMPEPDLAKRRFSATFATSVTMLQAAVGTKDYARAAELATVMAKDANAIAAAHPEAFNERMTSAALRLTDSATSITEAAKGSGAQVGPLFKEFRELGKEFLRQKGKDN